MTPPRVCPPPPDCPLYAQRLDYGVDEPLRRAVLMERPKRTLAELVWADMNRQYRRPEGEAPPTRPTPPRPGLPVTPEPIPLPLSTHLKGATNG